jgi:hypothetical protein
MDRTQGNRESPALRVRFILDATGDRGGAGRWRSMLAGKIGGALRLHHEHTGMDRTRATVKAPALRVRLDAQGDRRSGRSWPLALYAGRRDRRRSPAAP